MHAGEEWALGPHAAVAWSYRLSLLIAIAIAAMQRRTKAMAHPLHAPLLGPDIEGARGSHQDPPDMHACILSRGHTSPHQVARLEALDLLRLLGTRAREPITVHAAHLALAASGRTDKQRLDILDLQTLRRMLTHTGRIHPMRFGKIARGPMVLGQPTRTTLNRQSRGL